MRQVLTMSASSDVPVGRITLRIGPLAGVEPELLLRAFPLIAAGTLCAEAELTIEAVPVRVRCQLCRATSDVRPGRLLCAGCGAWRVTVISGDEMHLAGVALMAAPAADVREKMNV